MKRAVLILCLNTALLTGATSPDTATHDPLASFTEATRIEEITLVGNFPFLSRHIRRQLSIRPGDRYDEHVIAEQLIRIREYYQRNGYFDTTVTVEPKHNAYSQGMEVAFHIKRGTSLRWGDITVEGNHPLLTGRIRSAFPRWASYTPKAVRENARKIATALQQRGYSRARARVIKTDPDFKTGRMHITLRIDAGPFVDIHFDGNEAIGTSVLRKQLTFTREGRFDRYEIDASVEALRQYYHSQGYPHATVSFARERKSKQKQRITFQITEGHKQPLRNLHITGNSHFSDAEVRSHTLTHPVSLGSRGGVSSEILQEDLQAIKAHYVRAGFLDTQVGPVTRTQDDKFQTITIPIEEGKQYTVGRIAFQGNFNMGHEKLMQQLAQSPGRPIVPHAFEQDRQALQLLFEDNGFPYARVTQGVEYEKDSSLVHLLYTIEEDIPATIGSIAFSGDFITSHKAMRQALVIQEGDPYSDAKIRDSKRNLNRLGAFRNIHIERIGLTERAQEIHLAIRVEEERPYLIDFDLGYSSDDALTGGVKFVNNNAFGWAKRAQFTLLAGQERSRAEVSWIDPRLFGRDLVLSNSVFLDRNDDVAYDVLQAGGNIGLYRQYHRTGFSLQYELTRNRLIGGSTTVAANDGRRDSANSKISAGITFDTRDKFSQPTRGLYLFAQADLFNEIGGRRADFVKIRTGASHYFHLTRGIVFSQHGRLANIHSLGASNIPITERLFLGGEDTVRGFNEDSLGPIDSNGDPIGGEVRWIYNAELSVPVADGIRIAGFFDIGSLTNSYGAISAAQIRESAGVGLRYITPVGPLRADYAFKLNKNRGESTGRFHFTFGHIF